MKFSDNLGAAPKWLAADTVPRARAALEGGLARETWKYSSLNKTLGVLFGAPNSARAPLADVPRGVSLAPLGDPAATPATRDERPPAIDSRGTLPDFRHGLLTLDIDRYPLAGITAALAGEGWLIDIASSPDRPLMLNCEPGIGAPTVLRVHPGCRVEVREVGAGAGVRSAVRVLLAAAGSRVCWAQAELAGDVEQWWLLNARLEDNASLELHQHSAGARFRRLDTHVTLAGASSNCHATGAGLVGAGEHLDRQQVVEHLGDNTLSRSRLHNLARGRSRCSFGGRIHIHPGASGADADLTNRNLALDVEAEINTKPELEIYTDDVRCAHGATVGQIDENALFYLQSRGLPEALARRLLSIGFLAECIRGPLGDEVLAAFLARFDGDDSAAPASPSGESARS